SSSPLKINKQHFSSATTTIPTIETITLIQIALYSTNMSSASNAIPRLVRALLRNTIGSQIWLLAEEKKVGSGELVTLLDMGVEFTGKVGRVIGMEKDWVTFTVESRGSSMGVELAVPYHLANIGIFNVIQYHLKYSRLKNTLPPIPQQVPGTG